MEIKSLPKETQQKLIEVATVAADTTLSAAEKQTKLSAMKAETLASIARSNGEVGFVAKAVLDNLRKAIESESWKDIPPPEMLESRIQLLVKLTDVINAAESFIAPDILELQRFMKKVMLDRAEKAVGERVDALDRVITEAHEEFRNKQDAIEKHYQSAVISASVSLAVSVVEGTLSGFQAFGAARSMTAKKDISSDTAKLERLNEDHSKQVKDVKERAKEVKQIEDNIKIKKAEIDAQPDGESKSAAQRQLQKLKEDHAQTSEGLKKAEELVVSTKLKLQVGSSTLQHATTSLESDIQIRQITGQLITLVGKVTESSAKIGTSTIEKAAQMHEFDADRSRFRREMEEKIQSLFEQESASLLRASKDLEESVRAWNQGLAATMANITRI